MVGEAAEILSSFHIWRPVLSDLSFLTWGMQTSTPAFIRDAYETRDASKWPARAGVGQRAQKGAAADVAVTLTQGALPHRIGSH